MESGLKSGIMNVDSPLCFHPIIKRALWGGMRLERELGKSTGGVPDAAESWEVCDMPDNVSVVQSGPHAGMTLRQLMEQAPGDLMGRHKFCLQFPLLVKFLDASRQLSVQVHPPQAVRMPDGTVHQGKAESWIVMQAAPDNQTYLGLKTGVTEAQLREAARSGAFSECLHTYSVAEGDCLYLEPGAVHSMGQGLLVAEIQQPSDIAYRLSDWNRTDETGQPRELHLEEGIAAANLEIGPVMPVVPKPDPLREGSEMLVDCPYFIIHRHRGTAPLVLPEDNCMHLFVVLAGTATQADLQLKRGQTAVIPAARRDSIWKLSEDAILIDSHLPLSLSIPQN